MPLSIPPTLPLFRRWIPWRLLSARQPLAIMHLRSGTRTDILMSKDHSSEGETMCMDVRAWVCVCACVCVVQHCFVVGVVHYNIVYMGLWLKYTVEVY